MDFYGNERHNRFYQSTQGVGAGDVQTINLDILRYGEAETQQPLTLIFGGSNPSIATIYVLIAQLAEQRTFKPWVRGSIPFRHTK